jgi:1,4-dihydroxy-2-naphthoate octaprenyltransferase
MMQFREVKSLVVAVCMGYVTADTSMVYFCHHKDAQCNEQSLRTRSLCLAVLYQFLRETACDTRDIAEDARDGMKTLPVRLGKNNTLLLIASFGMLLEALITKAVLMTWSGIQVNPSLLIRVILRVGMMMGMYFKILQYPRGNYLAWGVMSLLGLVPVLWAQSTLLESE